MIPLEFLLTCLVVVLILGKGGIRTVATGLFIGKLASFLVALGCTLSIVTTLLVSALGLVAISDVSAVVFQVVKYLGVVYLLYLAWQMWRASSPLAVYAKQLNPTSLSLIFKGFLLKASRPLALYLP